MKERKYIASLFIPAYVPVKVKNKSVLFIPIDKGVVFYLYNEKSFKVLNKEYNIYENFIKENFKEIIENLCGIDVHYEVPLCWEFNTFYSTILGFYIIKSYINKIDIKIDKIIKEVRKYLKKKKLENFMINLYKRKNPAYLSLNNFYLYNFKDLNNFLIISRIYSKNYKVLITKLNDIMNYKIKKIYKNVYEYKFENCGFILTQSNLLIKIVDLLLNETKPEDIIISRPYLEGVQFYLF